MLLDRVSNHNDKNTPFEPLKRIDDCEFEGIASGQCRYAVASTCLPQHTVSSWAVDLVKLGFVRVGIMDSNDTGMNNGKFSDVKLFTGWNVYCDGLAVIHDNGQQIDSPSMRCEEGDVMLFQFNPITRELTMQHKANRNRVVVVVKERGGIYLTVNLCKHKDVTSRVRFRTLSSEEQLVFLVAQ
jgi:hypothetical protein